uniref:BTB domain-containing protein n=1 Tax=Chelydra serpentina TaxID=8475 RepID=A0A8C3SW46_CHESE
LQQQLQDPVTPCCNTSSKERVPLTEPIIPLPAGLSLDVSFPKSVRSCSLVCAPFILFPYPHRLLMAAVSPYFQGIFTSSFKESQDGEVVLQDMASSIVQTILNYLYMGEISLTEESAQGLFVAASRLQVLPLLEICSRFLVKNVSIENCLVYYALAYAHNNQALLGVSMNLITTNFGHLSKEDEDFLHLDLSTLVSIISLDGLMVASELVIYRAVKRWVRFQTTERSLLLGELIKHIHGPFNSRVLRQGMYSECIVCVGLSRWISKWMKNEEFHLPALNSLYSPACVAVGDTLYVSGGTLRDKSHSDALYKYDFFKGRWIHLPPMLVPRASHGFLASNQKLYALGGCCGFEEYLDSAECFDLMEKTWTPISRLPFTLSCSASAVLKDKLYLIGGEKKNDLFPEMYKGVLIYDVNSGTWTQVPLAVECCFAGAVPVNNGIYVIGGYSKERMRHLPIRSPSPGTCFSLLKLGTIYLVSGVKGTLPCHYLGCTCSIGKLSSPAL